MQIGGVANFERAYQPLPPGTKNLVMPQFSYIPDQFLRINEKSQNLTLFRVLPSQNIRTYSKNFYKIFGYRLGIAKISLKNLNSFLSNPEKT